MPQVRRAPLADQAAELLLERIRSGEWTLGAKLPGETTLGPQLGVGRSTVREAIRQLAGRGVLQARQGAGVFVIALDATDDWSSIVQRADIVAVLEARGAIESEAAFYAAQRRSPQALRAIRKALMGRTTSRDLEEHVDADLQFHRSVVEAAGNPLLLELFDTFVPRVRQTMLELLRLGVVSDQVADQEAHRQLADAIADRQADAAAQLSRQHLASLKDGLTAA